MKRLETNVVMEGVELLCEEERGFSKRRYLFSVIIREKDLLKINLQFKKSQEKFWKKFVKNTQEEEVKK